MDPTTPPADPPAPPAPAPADPPAPPSPAAPTPPEGLPSDFWDATAGQVKLPDLIKAHGDLSAAAKAQADARARLPQSPDGYDLALPADVTLPEGVQFSVDPASPLAAAVRTVAHEHGLPPAAVQKLVGAYAQQQIAQMQQVDAELQAERGKLGDQADQRIGAVENWLKANLPAAGFEALRGFVASAAAVEAIETLIQAANGGQIPTGLKSGGSEAVSEIDYYREIFNTKP